MRLSSFSWSLLCCGLAACSSSSSSAPPLGTQTAGPGGASAAAGGSLAGPGGASGAAAGSGLGAGAGGAAGVGPGAGGSDAAGGAGAAAGSAGAPDPGPNSLGIGPIPLAPGQETTVCVTRRLNNAEDIVASKLIAELAPGSHHLIAYRSDATDESPDPQPCMPFGGVTQNNTAPIMIVEKEGHNELVFPQNVGLKLAAHQMLKIEAHYINVSGAPLMGQGSLHAEGVPASQAPASLQLADLTFWGTTKIFVPPNGTYSTPVNFQPAISGIHGFAVTTHQHHFGTRMRIWHSSQAGDTASPPLADNSDWSHPPLFPISPEIAFNGQDGLSYQCEWKNTSSSEVDFGESALQEMCFLWMYYYPSHGFDICFDGHCLNRHGQ